MFSYLHSGGRVFLLCSLPLIAKRRTAKQPGILAYHVRPIDRPSAAVGTRMHRSRSLLVSRRALGSPNWSNARGSRVGRRSGAGRQAAAATKSTVYGHSHTLRSTFWVGVLTFPDRTRRDDWLVATRDLARGIPQPHGAFAPRARIISGALSSRIVVGYSGAENDALMHCNR